MANDSKLNILISAKDNASNVIKAVDSNIAGFNASIAGLVKGAGAMAVAMGAIRAGMAAFDLAKESAQVEQLRNSFDDLAAGVGESSAAMLSAMRAASSGTIADSSLILSANRAMLLGVSNSAEEMTRLLEVATARGRAMGLSTEQAFSDLVTGIGRMSPLILDNLGIVTGGEKVFEDYAASIGKAAAELSDAEKKQALVNKVISESAGLVADVAKEGMTSAQSFERMNASIQNAKEALGVMFGPAMVAIANQLADAVDGMTGKMMEARQANAQGDLFGIGDSMTTVLDELNRQITAMQDAAISGDVAGLQESANRIEMLRASLRGLAEDYNAAAAITGAPLLDIAQLQIGIVAFQDLAKAQADSTRAAEENQRAMAAQAAEADRLRGAINELVGRLRDIASVADAASASLRSSFLGIADTIGGAEALAKYKAADSKLQGMISVYEAMGLSAEEIQFRIQGMVNGTLEQNRALEKTATHVSTIDSAYEKLLGKVQSVLSGALDPGVGVDPSQFLPREDAINEDARRLADVAVNGFSSPWYEYLNQKFPGLFEQAMAASGGDVQQAAARLLQDFQDGLRPELLDKEAAKERIKRMLTGDANMAALAAEITQELQQEMGGQFSADQIAKATGTALGTDNIESSVEGTGTAAVAKVVGEIDGQASTITTSGQQAGRNWGTGFLATVGEAVPSRLIEILVAIVTPGVWQRIQEMGGLTGAEGGT